MTTPNHPDALLMWYVNGTLDAGERAQVERHLASCERCRRETELLRAVRAEIKRESSLPPTELGLRRLMRDVRLQRPARASWQRPALAAALAVVVIQTGLLVSLVLREPTSIEPLSAPPAEGVVLQVRFAENVTEAQIRAALQEVGAVVVDGPSALALYRVRIEDGGSMDMEQIERAMASLRARGVAEYVARD